MAKISGWQKALMKVKAKKEMKKMYSKLEVDLINVKDSVADIIENLEERQQTNAVIILCAEIIAGFEEKELQNFILDMIKETLKNLKD